MSEMLRWARWYRERGQAPMPLEPPIAGDPDSGKRPLLASWRQYIHTLPTVEEIEAWWRQWPEANIGLIQGHGTFVIDVDGPAGLVALVEATGEQDLSKYTRVATGKGHHFYFSGEAPKNAVRVLPQIDVRTTGGYVVAPPSLHASGARYLWANDLWPPAAAPAALLAKLAPPPPKPPESLATKEDGPDIWVARALEGVEKGERHHLATRLIGYLWKKGLPSDIITAIMLPWAERCGGDPPYTAKEILTDIATLANSEHEGGPQEPPATIREIVAETLRQVFAPKEMRPPVASTSLGSLDEVLDGGFYPGDYILMASRPSVGKSALALQIAHASAKRGAGVLIASLEMSKMALTRRMLVQESGLASRMLKTGEGFNEFTTTALMAAGEALSNMPIWVTTDVRTGEDLHTTLKEFEPGVLKLVVLDYLQIMSAEGRDGRARVEHCSKMVRNAAIKYNVPILCLSSLSRPPRDLDTWRPDLRDLRESGELEHDADIVVMLHRELVSEHTEIYVRKNRDGVAGSMIRALFDGQRQTFREGPK